MSDKSRRGLRGRIEALATRYQQQVETRVSKPTVGLFNRSIPTIQPADGVGEYYEQYKTTAIIFASLWNFSSDVWEPGYRIESDSDDVIDFFEDKWLPQAAVLFGEKHNDFLRFGKHTTIQRWARGGALIEHVRQDPEEAGSPITGVHFINPETVSFVPYEHKPILLDPEPNEAQLEQVPENVSTTKRDEFPAYIQYHKDAPRPTDRQEIPLSQNDVTRTIFNGDAAAVGEEYENFWGTPITEIVSDDVAGFKNILRDKEQAIKTKAWGLWRLAFDRETLEYTDYDDETGEQIDVTEIIDWSESDKDDVAEEIDEELGPGGILTHDGAIELDRLDGEVPDLIDDLEFYVSNITSALPTPLYIVGFESDINQFVTERQDARYQKLIEEERQDLERVFSRTIQQVADTHGLEYDTLKLRIEPPDEDSPVMSLDTETIEKMATFMEAFDNARGDIPMDMLVDPPQFLSMLMQIPEESLADLEDVTVDEEDPDVQEQAEELAERAANAGTAGGDD